MVCLSNAQILREAHLLALSNSETRASLVNRGDNTFSIDFSYLDGRDGVVIEILHTKCDSITCEGNIIDAGKPQYIGEFNPYPSEGLRGALIAIVSVIMLISGMWWYTLSTEGSVVSVAIFSGVYIPVLAYGFKKQIYPLMKFPKWSRTKK